MPNKIISRIGGVDIYWDGKDLTFTAAFACDGDGSPRCYSSLSSSAGLDSWASACYPDEPENYQNILVCDKHGKPIVQDGKTLAQPAKDFFISQTTYQRKQYAEDDCRRYLDAENIAYIVLPKKIIMALPGVFIGCQAEVTNKRTNKTFNAVTGDEGPNNKIGEGSIRLIHDLGFPKASPRNSVEDKIFFYRVTPNVAAYASAEKFELQPRVKS